MPYIKSENRATIKSVLELMPILKTKGELEYAIFYLMKHYMKQRDYRYTELHDCVYASMHCADEFRRRFLDKREDEAREKNGDV